jgi:tRNA/rRNA methyltransferase
MAENRNHKRDKEGLGPGPIIVLVEPQMGENIGAAARAMLNFGLTGLRLVAPRDGWPNAKAGAMAAGASTVVDHARVFDTVDEAIADCSYVLATTARQRELHLPVCEPAEAAAELHPRIAGGERCAILFGGERAGLSTEDIARCHGIFTIPVNPAFASLNLGQAVLVAAYEWAKVAGEAARFDSKMAQSTPASGADIAGMTEQLFVALDDKGYFYPPDKVTKLQQNLRTTLNRPGFTEGEVHLLRGVIKALSRDRKPGV